MLLVERGQQTLNPGSIADPRRNRFGKNPARLASTNRALFDNHPMFGHLELQGGKIKDPPPLLPKPAGNLTEHASTDRALPRFVQPGLLRFSHRFERRPRMTQLAAGFAHRRLPQRAPLVDKTITRRWLVARAASGGKKILQS